MNNDSNILVWQVLTPLLLLIWLAVCASILYLVHFLLTLPMRRAEQARLFLDLLDSTLEQGQPLEETLISVARSRDESLGVHFHLFAAWLEENQRFSEALARTPRLLQPQVNAMLVAGQKIGDIRKVLPACRQLLKDAVSQTRGAINYLVILTFVITPMALFVFKVTEIFVMPKYKEVFNAAADSDIAGIAFLDRHRATMVNIEWVLLLLLWLAALAYIGGPRIVARFPVLDRLSFHVPWRRKRMQRDFSTLLALLLDSGVPESEAVVLAADGTANSVFRRRSARAVEILQQGGKLTEAVQSLDDSGEFAWRLANAVHGHTGFLQALAGWHESLDAKAFQQEQAAAHGITSGLVLWSGFFVGAVVISVFMTLTLLLSSAVLW